MKKLIGKYRAVKLTPDELHESRANANAMSDDELSELIFADWNDFEPDAALMNKEAERRVYRRIASDWFHTRRRTAARLWRWISAAAVIAVPVLLFAAVYFYIGSRESESEPTYVSTGFQEKATVVLPDGSEITMNGNSKIGYNLAAFNRESRNITFSGEGYFKVAKDRKRPFIIDALGVEITVKGTVFDFQAYEANDNVSLYLLAGAVVMKSKKTDSQVELSPNEKAVMSRATGLITVSPIEYNDNTAGWKNSKLFFRNAGLSSVISQLEKHFDCTIVVNDSVSDEHFTGLIPVDNISGALSVIEKAFNTRLAVMVRE